MKTLGVVIGRFQVPQLTEAHEALIKCVARENTHTLVLVGKAPVMSTRNPIPARFIESMIRCHSSFNDILVDSIDDHPDDTVWAHKVLAIVERYVKKLNCEFINFYGGRDNGLKPLTMTGFKDYTDFEVVEATERFPELKKYNDVSGTLERIKVIENDPNSPAVRAGFIMSQEERYPTVYSTVDVAILDSTESNIWLGQKYPTGGLCFIGGFVDPADPTRAAAALRELREETGIQETLDLEAWNNKKLIQCIGDFKIMDWRYLGGRDAVMTTLFVVKVKDISTDKIKAGDDLYYIGKWSIEDLLDDSIASQHRHLFKALKTWLTERKG